MLLRQRESPPSRRRRGSLVFPAHQLTILQIPVFLHAVLAVAVEFQLVIHYIETIFLFNFILHFIEEIIGKFCHLSAAQTDEMVMGMGKVVVVQFVAASAVAEVQFFQKFQMCEKFQRAVNSGQADLQRSYGFLCCPGRPAG